MPPSPAGDRERDRRTLVDISPARAPESDGKQRAVTHHLSEVWSESGPARPRRCYLSLPPRVAEHRPLARPPLDALFSKRWPQITEPRNPRSAASRAHEIHQDSHARMPSPRGHDAPMIGLSRRCAGDGRARPLHSPVRARGAGRARVSPHFVSLQGGRAFGCGLRASVGCGRNPHLLEPAIGQRARA